MNLSLKLDKGFERDLKLVFILHILIAVLFVIGNRLDFFPQSTFKTRVIAPSVRVDIVAMPTMTVQELKKVKVSHEETRTVEEPDTNDTIKIHDGKKKKVNLKNLLKGFSSKKVVKKKKAKVSNVNLKKILLEGNKLSHGTESIGQKNELALREFDSYIQSLPQYVRPYWKLPSYLLDSGLRCRVQIFISEKGKVLNMSLFESSGNTEYDNRALKAIKAAGSFPPPKSDILEFVVGGKVVLGFPL